MLAASFAAAHHSNNQNHKQTGMSATNSWSPGDESLDELIRDLDFFVPSSAPTMQHSQPERVPQPNSSAMEVEGDPKTHLLTRSSARLTTPSAKPSQLQQTQQPQVPKGDYAVDHLDQALLNPFIQPKQLEGKNSFPSQLVTKFKKKYFRFDNKSLQCFPTCSRFPDVREARMLGLDHKAGGKGESFCTNTILASIMLPTSVPADAIAVVGRFLCATPDLDVLPKSDASLLDIGAVLTKLPQANCVQGTVQNDNVTTNTDQWGRREVGLAIQPEEAWFFNMTLPRHRRNASCAAHKVPLFVFELLVFVKQSAGYQLCSRAVSSPFEVASIRTLIREVLSYRQSNLPSSMRKEIDEDEEDEEFKPSAMPAKPVAAPTMSLRRQMAANYSSAVHKIRLAEANRREEQSKKKQELLIEVIPEPIPVHPQQQQMQSNMQIPQFERMDVMPSSTNFFAPQPPMYSTPFNAAPAPAPVDDLSFDIPDFVDLPESSFFVPDLNMLISSFDTEPFNFQERE